MKTGLGLLVTARSNAAIGVVRKDWVSELSVQSQSRPGYTTTLKHTMQISIYVIYEPFDTLTFISRGTPRLC